MKWFTGTIPDAIGMAKITDAIFVVYVHDTSEASESTNETLADETLASVLSSKKFVAIKLENGSESAKQFAQIYPVVVLPSLYFISGSTGIPLEILGGPLSKEKLKEKLDHFTKDEKEDEVVETSNDIPSQSSSSSQEKMEVDEPQTAAAEGSSSGSETPASIPNEAEKETIESTTEDVAQEDDNSEVPLEERVARAKMMLAEKQAQKAEERADDDKRKEIERRKMGQEIAKRKRQMYEDEMHSAVRERKKEKEEERLARERVKAQIAADRLEREKRAAMLQGEAPAPNEEPSTSGVPFAAASSSRNATVTRLKFRMPDGSSSIAQFPVETSLSEIRQHVQQQLVSSSSFMLTSTVHHKPFTPEDSNKSLSDLGLVPSAIIVVLMNTRTSGGGAVVSSQGGIMHYIWLLLSPITFLLSFVSELFSFRPPSESSSADESGSRSSPSQTTQQRPMSSYGRPKERRWQRDGNIHRLQGGDEDDEDDNNTWNGNSTQQM